MIEKLNHNNPEVSNSIRSVFQASYPFEAELVGAVDFPPLKRPLDEFINCNNVFLGYLVNDELAAVIEIDSNNEATHIQSLVVHPDFFRQGIARKLIDFVFESYNSRLFTVETGLKNQPAVLLYLKLGFEEVKQYNTEYGIRKIRFEKRTNN